MRHFPSARAVYRFIAVTSVTWIGCNAIQAQQSYEQLQLKASDVVPAALLKGPNHSVDEQVTVENFLPRFTIRSQYGVWEARGREMLDIRVSEISALRELDQVSRSSEFTTAMGRALAQPLQVAGDFVQKPGETTRDIVSGVGVMFGRVGRFVGTTAANAGDSLSGPAPQKTPIAAKPAAPEANTAEPRTFIGDPLGYNQARREWASKVKIDPYTSNRALSDKLSEVSRATFAGNFVVNTAIGAVAAPLHYTVAAHEQGTLEAYQYPPMDVQKRNEERLAKMGAEGAPVRAFFRNGYYTPTLQTVLVLGLESLSGAEGRPAVISFATNAANETEARYVNNAVLLLGQYSGSTAPIARVRTYEHFIGGETRDGKLVVALPLDVIYWNEPLSEFAQRTDLKGTEKQLLVSGKVTSLAKQQLAARGWIVRENAIVAR